MNKESENYLELANKAYTEKNYEEAFDYYEKAAEQGNVDAELKLGHMYEFGNGREPDYEKAKQCYKKVAELGDMEAIEALKRVDKTRIAEKRKLKELKEPPVKKSKKIKEKVVLGKKKVSLFYCPYCKKLLELKQYGGFGQLGYECPYCNYFHPVEGDLDFDLYNDSFDKGLEPWNKSERWNKSESLRRNCKKKEEFRHWLVEKYGISISTANKYVCGFEAAQKHFRLKSESKICFYDIDDINELRRIFHKYISGEYWVIGKRYSGAVRASLTAYLNFFYQKKFYHENEKKTLEVALQSLQKHLDYYSR